MMGLMDKSFIRNNRMALLPNDEPSNWITAGKGLKQGDPLSPQIFMLNVDVLDRMMK